MANHENPESSKGAFALLHKAIQEQLYKMRWTELRPVQVDSIRIVMETNQHLVISAATAGGKTEAAFLPVLSRILETNTEGVRAIYVGPLKALINDQFRRLEDLCSLSEIPVTKWHGDVGSSAKNDLLKNPSGVLLITPESIESLFINHSAKFERLFASLEFVVIDEIHAFVGSERGIHLKSLLCRVFQLCPKRPRIIGLSATVGDPIETARWIDADNPNEVRLVEDKESKRSVKYLIKGYLRDVVVDESQMEDETSPFLPTGADEQLAEDIIKHFYGKTGLIFANAKKRIEFMADVVRTLEAKRGMPDRMRVHHGSLSKAEREETETDLKSGTPTVAFCSSTLELGIDVGDVSLVGQIGPPWTVASLSQRLGRSGRRPGESAVMFMFVQEDMIISDADPVSRLYPELLQAIAMTELLLRKWCEPPDVRNISLSTMIQQVLSVIAQRGGVSAMKLFDTLVTRGAFRNVDQNQFSKVLRSLGVHDLVNQTPEGDLILGLAGERLVRSVEFYAVFMTSQEMSVIHQGRCIGKVATAPGSGGDGFIILAGRRWKIIAVDKNRNEIIVEPSKGGRLPTFASTGGGDIHDMVRQEMRQVLFREDAPFYLDQEAKQMLMDARKYASSMGIKTSPFLRHGNTLYWFTWSGTRVNRTLTAIAKYGDEIKCWDAGVAIGFENTDVESVKKLYRQFLEAPTPAEELATTFPIKATQKYDGFLSDEFQVEAFAAGNLDLDGAIQSIKSNLC